MVRLGFGQGAVSFGWARGFAADIFGNYPPMKTIAPIPSPSRRIFAAFLLLAWPLLVLGATQPPGDYPGTEPAHPPALPLWPNGAPGSEARKDEPEKVIQHIGQTYNHIDVSNIHNPSITPYLPPKDKASGVAVIIAPGGGHQFLAIDHEGYEIGQWLADHGIAGFVLKYRLERGSPGATYTAAKESLADAQRAIRTIRSRAAEWNINPAAVGIIGFSAGAKIATLAAFRPDPAHPESADPIEREGSLPDFQGLFYPDLSGLGTPDKSTPPAYLACAADDRPNISEGVATTYLLFHKAGVPVEMHIFGMDGHGFGLGVYKPDMPSAAWPASFVTWLGERGFIKKKADAK